MLKFNQVNRILFALFLVFLVTKFSLAADLATVSVISSNSNNQSAAPVTFGQVFKEGDVPAGTSVSAKLLDGTAVNLQVDKKATHGDGSLRHAILTMNLDVSGNASNLVTISQGTPTNSGGVVALNDVLNSSFDATVNINVGGVIYTASAKDFLRNNNPRQWLSGPLVSEWLVGGNITDSNNITHPHLMVYFYVRAYAGLNKVRVDFVIENDWTFESSPGIFDYDVTLSTGSQIYSRENITHYIQSRWHKALWWGSDPKLLVTHDTEYLQATKAVPNYMKGLRPSEAYLNSMTTNVEPMGRADLRRYFPATGANDQIGPLTRWDATYLVSGDKRALTSVLMNGSAGGSYSMHYRDKNTGYPVSIATYPRLSEDKNGYLVTEASKISNPNPSVHDNSHHPSIGYLAYVLSGDYYYLEEIQFWANWNMIWTTPNKRQNEKGIFLNQNRGRAWSLRTLGQAAYITPDDHMLKQYFVDRIINNIEYRNTNRLNVNNLGAIPGNAYPKFDLWQNDFMGWAFGYLVELGFNEATAMRDWMSKFPAGRMGISNSEYCFQSAAIYRFSIGIYKTVDTFYPDFRSLYEANLPSAASGSCNAAGEMEGRSFSNDSYYSNMQPALAISVDSGVADYNVHWARFVGLASLPDYNDKPTWAIVPRAESGTPKPLIAMTASSAKMTVAGNVKISWTVLNADSCTASGGWVGNKAVGSSNLEDVFVAETSTFSLGCVSAGGRTVQTVTVNVGAVENDSSMDNNTSGPESVSDTASTDVQSTSSTSADETGGAGAMSWFVLSLLMFYSLQGYRRREL